MGLLEVKHGLLQIAESLDFLHINARLIHRAIAPENVFITSSGSWKLGGFGFAISSDQISNNLANVQAFHYAEYDDEDSVLPLQPSLNYTAPELVRAKGSSAGCSSDIFSFGRCYKDAFVGGKTNNVSKTHKKGGGGGLGGRKPLGEISNSVKQHAVNQHQRSPVPWTSLTAFMKEENATTSVGGKKSFSKPKEKLQTGVRKPLGDISNSRKLPSLNRASKKSSNNLNVLVEEEPFLHNHQECVKAQRKAIDMDYFLQTIGLEKDSSMQLAAASPKILPRPMKLMNN